MEYALSDFRDGVPRKIVVLVFAPTGVRAMFSFCPTKFSPQVVDDFPPLAKALFARQP